MVGFGYDSHRLIKGGKLVLGGIKIDSEFGIVAHSDGDALIHAVCDAILGAAGLGDIGEHFPDSDIQYKNADSIEFLKIIIKLISEKQYSIINIDATVLLETPKLSNDKKEIRNNIALVCGLPIERVSIKAKTNEKMGFVGQSEGIAVYCICELKETN